MASFDLDNVDPSSHNFQQKEFVCGSTYSQVSVFLTLLGAELAEGHYTSMSPLQGAPFSGPLAGRGRGEWCHPSDGFLAIAPEPFAIEI